MIYIPTGIPNAIFFVTCYLSGYQHVQMQYENPIKNIQFFMVAFSLVAIVFIATRTEVSPIESVIYFAVSVICFALIYRRLRFMPPRKPIE